MKCERVWQAEALADGRLGNEHRVSFERHLASCVDCRDEQHAIASLRDRARAAGPGAKRPLDHRRQRERLLAAANHALIAPTSRVRAASLLVAAAMALASIAWLVSHRRAREVEAIVSPHYQVTDLGAARWSVQSGGPSTRLALTTGKARFRVRHLTKDQHFVVTVPDGELEVRGTEFTVTVSTRTDEVEVHEGVVAVRISGTERILTAGMKWTRSVPPAASIEVPTAITSSSAPAPSVAHAKPNVSHPGSDFAKAMAAFDAGEYLLADRLFAAFAKAHPSDARVEDAAFIRAVAASRRGDVEAARRHAQAYLAQYPGGFHATEVRKLAD